jgi:glycosyltransferase involved in cell wall biosynthesis
VNLSLLERSAVERSDPWLIVLSHQRWDFPVRRTQHLMLRLASYTRVLFVEPAQRGSGAPRLDADSPRSGIDVLTPVTPFDVEAFDEAQLPPLRGLLADWLQAHQLEPSVAWATSPRVAPLLEVLTPSVTVYDCIDHAATAHDAQRNAEREAALLARCQMVLAPGPSAVEDKRRLHPYVLCVPNAVDAHHFSPHALNPGSPLAREAARLQSDIGGTRLGCFGMIDERVDFALLAALADARRDWHIVMVGPVGDGCAGSLPQRPNLHWLGAQPYALLPYLAASWQLCLVPFALDAATRLASPSRTLEYMAAEKPVVSTAIADMVSLYGDVAEIARDRTAFIATCEQVMRESPQRRAQRTRDMLIAVSRASWGRTADSVHELIEQQLKHELRGRTAPQEPATPTMDGARRLVRDSVEAAGAQVRALRPLPR